MSNQVSTIPFGTDATKISGYMFRTNDRLGNFDLQIDNTGPNSLYFQVKEQTNPSGAFVNVGPAVTIVPKGIKTISLNLLSKKLGFFGSGNTTANVQVTFRNPSNLAGAQWDLVVTGRKGWGYDPELAPGEKLPNWGNPDNIIS
jgi:hypothetical protein